MRVCVAVGLMFAVACTALAGEEPKERAKQATGTFVAAELAGEVVKWQIDLGGDAGKKTYEMAAAVRVTYTEKDGAKQGQSIRGASAPDRAPREGTVAAKGKFTSAKVQGDNVLVTVALEGDKTLEVTLPKKLQVRYREEGAKLTASSIGIPRTRPAAKGEAK